jgi:hypothetical protein
MFPTEYMAKVFPWIGRRRLAQGEIAYRHVEIKNPVWWPEQPDYLPSCRKSHPFATGMIPACARNDLGGAVFTVRGSSAAIEMEVLNE